MVVVKTNNEAPPPAVSDVEPSTEVEQAFVRYVKYRADKAANTTVGGRHEETLHMIRCIYQIAAYYNIPREPFLRWAVREVWIGVRDTMNKPRKESDRFILEAKRAVADGTLQPESFAQNHFDDGFSPLTVEEDTRSSSELEKLVVDFHLANS